MRRTYILHAKGAKLPSDLFGLTCIRYGDAVTAADVRIVNQKLKEPIEHAGAISRIDGFWWQFSLTARTAQEPSAVSLLQISRARDGALEITAQSWGEDGRLTARYWSKAAKDKQEGSAVFYYFKGERLMDPNAPQLEGTGEIRIESADRANGYWTTRTQTDPTLIARTAGIYIRADPGDMHMLDGDDDEQRANLIAERLKRWNCITKT